MLNSPHREDPLGEPVLLGGVDSDGRRSARGGCHSARRPPPWKRGHLPTGGRAAVAWPCPAVGRVCGPPRYLVWNTRPTQEPRPPTDHRTSFPWFRNSPGASAGDGSANSKLERIRTCALGRARGRASGRAPARPAVLRRGCRTRRTCIPGLEVRARRMGHTRAKAGGRGPRGAAGDHPGQQLRPLWAEGHPPPHSRSPWQSSSPPSSWSLCRSAVC